MSHERHGRLAVFFFALLLLTPSISLAITLREYEQARTDPARQAKILKDAYDTTLSTTLVRLKSATFADGKAKTPTRIQSDSEQAQRIEQFGPHLTNAQTDALMSMIAQYAAAQPETELEAVITGFLLIESESAFQRYQRHYRDFKARMGELQNATNEAQVELNVEKLALDDRRRQLDTTAKSREISTESIEAMMKTFDPPAVVNDYIASVLSPTDAAGRKKGLGDVDADQRRAALALEIGKNYDTDELARRIFAAIKAGADVNPQQIFKSYLGEELTKRANK